MPVPTSPENVIAALQVIYNDRFRNAGERLAAYTDLLDPAFVFRFQSADVALGMPEHWGLSNELAVHEHWFDAQDRGEVYSVELRIIHDPVQDLSPQVGREGWKEALATNVYLRVMFSLQDGVEVNGGQARFLFPPPNRGRYAIAEWTDLPHPGAKRYEVEPTTWGAIKAKWE